MSISSGHFFRFGLALMLLGTYGLLGVHQFLGWLFGSTFGLLVGWGAK